ncbi:MAG: sugar phosphate isomerase/epimerase family protein [Methanomassiliicoccaceae archaeon]|nr:sugar phosphate isomerase/epimerase family protein [Methanomassiliicoccaceae archaeon]
MIGVSCPEFSANPFEKIMEAVSKEFRHWEIFAEAEHSLPLIWARLNAIKSNYKMTFSIHSPISDTNLAALTERMRESSIIEMISTAEMASETGIKIITVHPGLSSMSVPGMESKAIEKAKKSMRTLDRTASEYGVTYAIENMPSYRPMIGKTAAELNEIIEGTNLSVCFDIGHANTMGQIDEMISAFKDRIVNVHVHDNMGDDDSHLTVGDGNVDFPKVMEAMSWYKGRYIIESKSLASAVESKRRLSILLE